MSLVAEYAFNEGTGTSAADTSGGSHTATVTAWATGHTGTGAAGDSTHPAATYTGSLITGTTFTLMGWFKANTISGLPDLMALGNASTMAGSYVDLYRVTATTIELEVKPTGGSYVDSASFTIPNPQTSFVHLAVSISGTTATIYANGTSVGTHTWTGSLGTLAFLTAGGNTAFGTYNTATVDDLRVFNTALTATDITTYMNTPAGATTYTATGTVSGVSNTAGSVSLVPRIFQVTGTSSASSTTSGTASSILSVTGTVSGITGVSGDATRVTSTHGATGIVSITSTASGSVYSTLQSTGSVAAISSVAGSANRVAKIYSLTGQVVATTASSGSADIISGSQTYSAAGEVVALSTTAGSITSKLSISASNTVTSHTVGNVSSLIPLSGMIHVTSQAVGTPKILQPQRDISVTASPAFTDWKVMAVTKNPTTAGNINLDNGYTAGQTNLDPWSASATSVGWTALGVSLDKWEASPITTTQWAAGPIWIQES